ncbi:MAG TPA: CDP-diacylglycerol--serine O-phosphatidyltransferase [Deltaproteobacteria bacterium]|nr:MAG: CDP-diacylglycerol--serine O-phosphatidyltransferase [Deltaproteobacteria bacterium]HDM77239.1 CDP-diacylglycerol--serine O-phosphatidyltransferase [Deltaproteobacteria bacterium]
MSANVRRRYSGKKHRNRSDDEIRRGIYILPNIFTTANLFSGFFGLIAAVQGKFNVAAIAILISCMFDILDGKVARMTKSSSRFGVEYDSLADLVAFGVTPAILMYLWTLQPFGRLGWSAAFFFVACGALRLARFNVQVNSVQKKYFVGLPIPGAACMVATTVLIFYHFDITPPLKSFVLLFATFGLSFLMISNIKYNSFKDSDLFRRKPFQSLLLTVFLFTIVAARPTVMLFSLMLLYTLSGPARYAFGLRKKVQAKLQPTGIEPSAKEGDSITRVE